MGVSEQKWLKRRMDIACKPFTRSQSHTRSVCGFTLVELLVVMVVVGVMLSLIQIAITPNPQRVISRDAERLALTLSAAQAQAAATGRAMRLEAVPGGWRFAQRSRNDQEFDLMAWEPIVADEVFGPKRFETEGATLSIPPGGAGLGLEPIGAPLSFTIAADGLARVVASDGAGGFRVVQPE
jgi:general secretion pathway protein H